MNNRSKTFSTAERDTLTLQQLASRILEIGVRTDNGDLPGCIEWMGVQDHTGREHKSIRWRGVNHPVHRLTLEAAKGGTAPGHDR